MRSHRCLLILVVSTFLATVAWGQGNGQFLCSGGTADGSDCSSEVDCPGGVCVVTQGICDGGNDDGLDCECAGGTCGAPACSDDASAGTCNGGVFQGECCNLELNCSGGNPCRGTQRICDSGDLKGLSCLKDADCAGGTCRSSGKLCFSDRYPCFDDGDCVNSNDHCDGPGSATPTPSPSMTPGGGTPIPTRTPGGPACVGDCSNNGEVTVDELLRLVNIALGNLPITDCPAGNPNADDEITIDEILAAVNNALGGCPFVASAEIATIPHLAATSRRQRRGR